MCCKVRSLKERFLLHAFSISFSLCGVIVLRMRAFLLNALFRLNCAAARANVNSGLLSVIRLKAASASTQVLLTALLRLSCAAARRYVNSALLSVIHSDSSDVGTD